jgi:hypothetical protein
MAGVITHQHAQNLPDPHWLAHGNELGIDTTNASLAQAAYRNRIIAAVTDPTAKTAIGIDATGSTVLLFEANYTQQPIGAGNRRYTNKIFVKAAMTPDGDIHGTAFRPNEGNDIFARELKSLTAGQPRINMSMTNKPPPVRRPEPFVGGFNRLEEMARERPKSVYGARFVQPAPAAHAAPAVPPAAPPPPPGPHPTASPAPLTQNSTPPEHGAPLSGAAAKTEGTVAESTTAALARDSEVLGHEVAAVRKLGKLGPIAGPPIVYAGVFLATNSPKEAAAAALETAVPGASTNFKSLRSRQTRLADKLLDAADTGTGTVATVAGGVAVASALTGPGSIAAGTVALTSGTMNLGVQLLRDVAYYSNQAEKPGLVGTAANAAQTGYAHSGPELQLLHALHPLHVMQSTILRHGPELHHKVSPELWNASIKFGLVPNALNLSTWSADKQMKYAAHFAHDLAKELQATGPGGDAVRQALAPALQKAGATPQRYAQALESYAQTLDGFGATLQKTPAEHYAHTVQGFADYLQNPPSKSTAPTGSDNAGHHGTSRRGLQHVPNTTLGAATVSPPAHLGTGKGHARHTLATVHRQETEHAVKKQPKAIKSVQLNIVHHYEE